MDGIRGFLLHIGVIGSFVCLIARVLDWYNPFMDFAGHIWFARTAVYFTVIILALLKRTHKRTS